jgi:hypothetical protein
LTDEQGELRLDAMAKAAGEVAAARAAGHEVVVVLGDLECNLLFQIVVLQLDAFFFQTRFLGLAFADAALKNVVCKAHLT